MPPVSQTGPCSQLPLAVILAPRARPRHNGFVVHAWLHRAGCRAVRDSTLVAWYRFLYAPRTGGAYDGHHRTTGIAGRTRRRGGGLAARDARATVGDAGDRISRSRF